MSLRQLPLRPSTRVVSCTPTQHALTTPRTRAERRADAIWQRTALLALRQPITVGPRLVEVSRGRTR